MKFEEITYRNCKAQISCGDALELLQSIPANSIKLFLTSPPYCLGKEYDKSKSLADFVHEVNRIADEVDRVISDRGSICWQVGNHTMNSRTTPLDAVLISLFHKTRDWILRNRIVWTFGHGMHASKRFSARHETILWYTKSERYDFDLDAVRVPQKYPGKKYYKGNKKGQWSGNPLGKNPSDVWDIPNVKAGHVEKIQHPCQFPASLASRLIRALTTMGDTVLDPYMGTATVGVSALIEGRNFIGTDICRNYVDIAIERLQLLVTGDLRIRPDVPVRKPSKGEAVAAVPPHFIKDV